MKGPYLHLYFLFGLSFLQFPKGTIGIYFTQSEYLFCTDIRVGTLVGQVQTVRNLSNPCDPSNVHYRYVGDHGSPAPHFSVNRSGWVHILSDPPPSPNVDNGYHMNVEVGCVSDTVFKVATVVIKDKSQCRCGSEYHRAATVDDTFISNYCFQRKVFDFFVEENVASVDLGKFASCDLADKSISRKYVIQGTKDQNLAKYFNIDNGSSSLSVLEPFDRESASTVTFSVRCDVVKNGKVIGNKSATVTLNVGDVNDNPIVAVITTKKFSDRREKSLGPKKNRHRFVLKDKDGFNCSTHAITRLDDPNGVCRDAKLFDFQAFCQLRIEVDRSSIPEDAVQYVCVLGVSDPGYMPFPNSTFSNTTVLTLKISNAKLTTTTPTEVHFANVSSLAAPLTRVFSFESVGLTNRNFFTNDDVFRITKKTGILYLSDTKRMTKKEHNVYITVVNNNKPITGDVTETILITVKIRQEGTTSDCGESVEKSCSFMSTKAECSSSCGYGSENGKCFWRSSVRDRDKITTRYRTCTFDTAYCPNGFCDELEQLKPLLCPQDCTEKIIGSGRLNANLPEPHGIYMAAGTCWCDYAADCRCIDKMVRKTTEKPSTAVNKTEESRTDEGNMALNVTTGQLLSNSQISKGDEGPCDETCRTTIAATVGCLGAAVCVFILAWRLRKLRCQNSNTMKKHMGSLVSVSAVPSDYHDDREMYRNVLVTPQWHHKGPLAYNPAPEDKKWEFERDKLVLDATLGEGEFGRVVKAKAYNMDGKDGYKEVAVKMLKNCASTAELSDLLSEFNLLKDVNHPNVIRLLGACTKDGPFYVIVEYCEQGSLLHYLRRSRLEENGYVNNRFGQHDSHFRHGDMFERELLTFGDLLSFAWQIAKGMKYLSDIKLVHRDLAARNVLVATGKVLKISDFGLTRDVYEADTYLKQSKGRIPVKWLAPESLYAQIYTTLSDVWSFGIVLWEIVTLGAPPYPGIPPERLYNLLIAGYRMDKPESCSDELYAVMQKCWKSDPNERPPFSHLTEIFDRLLQQRTEYLDLTGGVIDPRPDVYDRCFGAAAGKQSDGVVPHQGLAHRDQYGSISVVSSNNEPYLTPSSSSQHTDPEDKMFTGHKIVSDKHKDKDKFNLTKCLEPKDNIDEKLSLLPDTGTVLFSPSVSEVEDEWESRETDALPVQVC